MVPSRWFSVRCRCLQSTHPSEVRHLTNKQNLARERAKHFGSEEAENPAKPTPTHRGHLIPTFSSSVIVTTTADDALADGALMSPEEEKEFELKPRGFFADQFEVNAAL